MTTSGELAKRIIGLQAEYKPLLEQRRRQSEAENEEEMSSEELQAIYHRFLALDEHKMPEPGVPPFDQVAPQVRKEHVIYTLSRINYRSTRASIHLFLSWGKPLHVAADAEEMLMWLDAYEEQVQQ